MKFEETYLNDNILDALYDMRFEEMTPIQEKCIPEILDGRDVLGVAQTGTGKTAAYLLPMLSMLDDGYADFPDGRHYEFPSDAINCVIMAPTRELAQQIDQAMQGFGYYLPYVNSVAVYGGNDGNRYYQELNALKTGASVIIATPGRFISHLTMGNVDMSRVSFFVLDEADRMLDMGFSDDILKIASYLPKTCQTVMFSATMPDKIEQLAKTLLKNPVEVKIAVSKPAEKIQQSAYICHEPQKLKIIEEMFKQGDLSRVIIFAGKINKVKDVYHALLRLKINAGQMHSDLTQAERDEMMFRFKSGQVDVLVATDILSRGIDIDDIAMVVNYDVPRDAEDYVHRIGRTARAERDGKAVTFVNEDDIRYFMQIERFLEREVQKMPLPEGIGEGPEYKSNRPQRDGKGRKRGGHGRKGRGGRNGKGCKHNDKPAQNKANTAQKKANPAQNKPAKPAHSEPKDLSKGNAPKKKPHYHRKHGEK